MSRKLIVNRLEKDELEYELKIRGIGVSTVDEMRQRLSLALRYEKSGDSLKYPPYPFKFEEDFDAIEKKFEEVRNLIDVLDNGKSSNEAVKLRTKVNHVLGRIDNMNTDDADEKKKREDLVVRALTLLEDFDQKIEDNEKKIKEVDAPAGLSILEGGLAAAAFQENIRNVPRSSLHEDTADTSQLKMIPPHKWDLEKFTGTSRSISVTAFFEKIEELSTARRVPKSVLFESGYDLFGDKAYQFYKDCRNRVNSWDELMEEFRREYLPAHHRDVLFEELRRRTQHSSETIGVYLAVMGSYFNRLRCSTSEEAKMAIILKNLHPYYQDRLRDPLPRTLDDLRAVCRRIEAMRDSINNYVEPTTSRRANILERDLAYVDTADQRDNGPAQCSSGTRVKKPILCWNCKREGHRAIDCTSEKKIYCYGCRKEGVTKKTCDRCNKGNGERLS